MKSKNTHTTNYINNTPQRDSAPKLQRLYNTNSTPFKIPTAKEIILERIALDKWFEREFEDIIEKSDDSEHDDEIQELCGLIGVDWQDVDPSIIDMHFANKQKHLVE